MTLGANVPCRYCCLQVVPCNLSVTGTSQHCITSICLPSVVSIPSQGYVFFVPLLKESRLGLLISDPGLLFSFAGFALSHNSVFCSRVAFICFCLSHRLLYCLMCEFFCVYVCAYTCAHVCAGICMLSFLCCHVRDGVCVLSDVSCGWCPLQFCRAILQVDTCANIPPPGLAIPVWTNRRRRGGAVSLVSSVLAPSSDALCS